MDQPDFLEEIKLARQGFNFVVGLDEAGRGPLAGPVVAGAVCFDFFPPLERRVREDFLNSEKSLPASLFKGRSVLRDSKQLSKAQRERWYEILTNNKHVKWGVGVISQKIIDKINILEATKLAMKRALANLAAEPDYLILDGNFLLEDLNISQKAIISGDEKIVSIAAASIIAKVTRDRLMRQYDKKFPLYGFAQHKGYGTKKHFAALKLHGPCSLHRFSFKPVRRMKKK